MSKEKTNNKQKLQSSIKHGFVGDKQPNKLTKKPNGFSSFINHFFTISTKKWQKNIQKKTEKKTVKKKSKILKFLKLLFLPFVNPYLRIAIILAVVVLTTGLIYTLKDLPSPRNLTSKENFAVSTQIFDRQGKLLYEIFADENRIPISSGELPIYVKQATIAIEDRNFYHHFGFDVVGITRAIIKNINGGRIEGGSTITQQLVKNALLTREKSLDRKIKEAILSVATELIYSKEEILEMYLNYISYGGTAVGIEAASEQYFDKSAKDLNLEEAALLAGLPQAPSKYSPFGSNPERAKARQAEVLRRMTEDGYISPLQAEEAKAKTLQYAISKTDIQAPHFVFFVRDLLYEKYGVETVEKGGLRVTTTLDLDLQNAAQASLSSEVNKLKRHNISNGAALITKPNTGEILAMIGSSDYFNEENDGKVNVTLSLRQPGSSIKPLMYATAFQQKLLSPGSLLLDIPTCFKAAGQSPYCPKNYDGSFRGPVTVRESLGNSLNIPAVKALKTIGIENFMAQAKKMGITTWKDAANYGLSLTLGGGEIKMIDMAQAFSVLADKGVKVPLTPILKIENYKGELIEETNIDQRLADLEELTDYDETQKNDLERVMDQAPAYLTAHIMQDNNARTAAFGPKSKLIIPNQVVSAKTGTTNNLKDNWTVGFTPEYLVITWVGNNDGSPMNPYLVSGITGAAPIWNDIMSLVLTGQKPVWQEKPSDVASSDVCASGLPPKEGENCSFKHQDLYWQRTDPAASTVEKKNVWIKVETGLPPQFGEQAEGLVLEEKTLYSDPVTKEYCGDCNRPVDEEGKVIYEEHNVESDYQINMPQE